MKTQILDLMREGIGTDVIRSFVRAHPLSTPLSAAEIIDWKKAGIPDTVIDAPFPSLHAVKRERLHFNSEFTRLRLPLTRDVKVAAQ